MNSLKFFQSASDTFRTRHKLPHWQQSQCVCGMTFRLADSLPQHLLNGWREVRESWLEHHPKPWTDKIEDEYHERFTKQIQRWLDQGYGGCVLKEPEAAAIVSSKLHERDGVDYVLWSYVIMPNHVHVLFSFKDGEDLPMIAQRWKGGSSRGINALLGRKGRLWQPDYFDRLVRNEARFAMGLDYIVNNPLKAKLRAGEFLIWEREEVRDMV